MTIETRHLRQNVTHWPISGDDGYGGFTYGSAVLMSGRWEERSELFITPGGEEETSAVIAYTADDISIGDYLASGDQTGTADPTEVTGAYRVRQYTKIPDLRALSNIRKSFL
tara:strand:- start:1840 stop:2175 length:336 start_codon:yes stop_codon:yes gene_type:complete